MAAGRLPPQKGDNRQPAPHKAIFQSSRVSNALAMGIGRSMSKIILDKSRLIAFSAVSGFLDAEHILKLTAEIDELVEVFGQRLSDHGRLFDLSAAKVASPEVINALASMTVDPARLPFRANRVAYFGASPLLQLQLKRLCAVAPRLAVFDHRAAAYSWATSSRDNEGQRAHFASSSARLRQ